LENSGSGKRKMDLGLPDGIIQLFPFNPEWSESFTGEKRHLDHAVGDQVVDIQHIGSTSLPGMPAKPILDIGIAVVDFEAAKDCVDPIVGLGYEYKGEYGIPRMHFFLSGAARGHIIFTCWKLPAQNGARIYCLNPF